MPRNITITFGDGTSHVYQNAPDDLTPEQVSSRAEKEFGKPVAKLDGGKQAPEEGVLGTAARWAKNIGTGLAKGAVGLATAAGDAFADDPQIRFAVKAVGGTQPQVGDVSKMVAPMGYQPRNDRERIVQALAAGVGGGIASPGGLIAPARNAAIGMSAAGGSEAANMVSSGNKAATIAGGLVGGLGAGVASSIKGNSAALAREALRDVKPKDLEDATFAMADAARAGVPINLSQAMPNPSNIDTVVNALANSRYGTRVTKQLRDQPNQVAFGMEDQLASLPGNIRAPQVVANNAQEVATQVINNAKKDRQNTWKRTFDDRTTGLEADAMGKTVDVKRTSPILDAEGRPMAVNESKDAMQMVAAMPESAVSDAYKRLGDLAAARPNTGVASELLALRGRLRAGDSFITDTYKLNEILKDASARLKSPNLTTQGVDAGGSKFLANTINDLRKGWGEKFSPYREANAAYSKMTDEVVNPLKKSVVGDIAGRRGALPDVEATKNKLVTVFDSGTVPGAKSSEILTLEKAFRAIKETDTTVSGSAAYQDAVKTWMAQRVSAASKQHAGRVDQNVAAHLEQAFMGNDTKSQGFKDILVGLARSEGKPDTTYVTGMTKFLKVASMAARRPGTVQGVSQGGAAEIAGRTVANAGGTTTVNPVRNLMLRWSERLQADAYKEMDRLLTSPEGVDMLQKLAKEPVMSPAAQAAMATFLGANAAQLDDPAPAYGQ